MRILILYGTTEGHTRKIAMFIAERLVHRSHSVSLIDSANPPPTKWDLANYDAAIIAARVHAGLYPFRISRFVKNHRAMLNDRPAAFVSVSMAAAGHRPGDEERAARYATRFLTATGWQPKRVYHAAGARLYQKHNLLGRWVLGIVDRHRYDTGRDHEFTDWTALGRFADDWAAGAESAVGAARSKVPG